MATQTSASSDVVVRHAEEADVPALNDIYNHYVVNTPVTFDLQAIALRDRLAWFQQFGTSGRHQLLTATEQGRVVGYACTRPFRAKAAYDTTVETSVFCEQGQTGRGISRLLYEQLFSSVADEDIRLVVAGITLPNDASVALHERFGFTSAGVMHEVGRKFDKYWDVGWFEKRLG